MTITMMSMVCFMVSKMKMVILFNVCHRTMIQIWKPFSIAQKENDFTNTMCCKAALNVFTTE